MIQDPINFNNNEGKLSIDATHFRCSMPLLLEKI